jgi:hypothetical protein
VSAEPEPLAPDTKSWTWVLERPCPDCGFDAATVAPQGVASLLRANQSEWVRLLAGPEAQMRHRVRPDRWSALEYACHVRDVFALFELRLALMLFEVDPLFANWDQDATALEDRYDLADPVVVSAELATAAERLAAAFDAVGEREWGRTGRRSDGASFTVDSFSRYLIHDPIHHIWDVATNLGPPTG